MSAPVAAVYDRRPDVFEFKPEWPESRNGLKDSEP